MKVGNEEECGSPLRRFIIRRRRELKLAFIERKIATQSTAQ
jgi:hypothetical protein